MPTLLHPHAQHWADRQAQYHQNQAKNWEQRLEQLGWEKSGVHLGLQYNQYQSSSTFHLSEETLLVLLKNGVIEHYATEEQKIKLLQYAGNTLRSQTFHTLLTTLSFSSVFPERFYTKLIQWTQKADQDKTMQTALDFALSHPDVDLSYDQVMEYFKTSIDVTIAKKLLHQKNIQLEGRCEALMVYLDEHFTTPDCASVLKELWKDDPHHKVYEHLFEHLTNVIEFAPFRPFINAWVEHFFLPYQPNQYSIEFQPLVNRLNQILLADRYPYSLQCHELVRQIQIDYDRSTLDQSTEEMVFAKPTVARRL